MATRLLADRMHRVGKEQRKVLGAEVQITYPGQAALYDHRIMLLTDIVEAIRPGAIRPRATLRGIRMGPPGRTGTHRGIARRAAVTVRSPRTAATRDRLIGAIRLPRLAATPVGLTQLRRITVPPAIAAVGTRAPTAVDTPPEGDAGEGDNCCVLA